jgi:hypothetical protein
MKTQPGDLRTEERKQQIKPVYLYYFKYGATKVYFSNFDQSLIVNGGPAGKMTNPQTFLRAQIKHDRSGQSMDQSGSGTNVTLAATDPNLRRYFMTCPTDQIDIEIFRGNATAVPNLEYDDDLYLDFKGVGSGIGFNDSFITLNCASLLLHDDRQVPRYYYQKLCQAEHYGRGCLLDPALFSSTVATSAVDRVHKKITLPIVSFNIDSPARLHVITDESFQGGRILDPDGNKVAIMAAKKVGATVELYLAWWPPNMIVGTVVTATLGCQRITKVCDGTFKNLPNFRGMPYISTQGNPAVDGIST